MKIGFIGLGRMGAGLAQRLLAAGHELAVYNRTREKAERLSARGARVASSPADAANGAEVVMSMLADDAAVSAVTLGDSGIVKGLSKGAIHLSLSTVSPKAAQELARVHRDAEQVFLAAPVLGRPEAAAQGALTVLVAGPRSAVECCQPLFEVIGRHTYVLGEAPEKASVAKIAANLLLATMIESLGEAFGLVEGYGLPAEDFLHLLEGSPVASPAVASYGPLIAERRFEPAGFSVKLGAKDARLAVEAGEDVALPMPIASLLHERFIAALSRGLGGFDWAVVGRRGPRAPVAEA